MAFVTRTINPLPFGDLEPKRFEDLVRNLMYGFKNWHSLEATGRSGSDDGFDIRGWEREYIEENEDNNTSSFVDKMWLIQCKREKTITPKKLTIYLEEILNKNKDNIYGIIFAVSSDLSKTARDSFREICVKYKIEEYYALGKPELEDLIFQPKNDGLLFAYFGISLMIRRRSLKTEINAKIAMKKKANSVLPLNDAVLIRDPNAENYPVSNGSSAIECKWGIYKYVELDPSGLKFLIGKYYAYIDKVNKKWDSIKTYKDREVLHNDPWDPIWAQENFKKKEEAKDLWEQLEEENRGFQYVYGLIPYENIIAIDELGDNLANIPHMYVEFVGKAGPFSKILSYAKPCQHNSSETISILANDQCKINIFNV